MKLKTLLAASLALVALIPAAAAVKLPALIGDGMVVQRGEPVMLWGTADPGETVAVSLSTGSNTFNAVADNLGNWKLQLPELPAGGPYEITVNGLTLRNVMSGDVFLCSGQSNMELPVRRVTEMFGDEVKDYSNDAIRQFLVPQVTSFHGPLSDTPGGNWKTCTPDNALDFSALGYFFAKQLNAETGVPVGIINSSWGGTPVEAWISEETMSRWPDKLSQKKLYEDDGYRSRIKQLEGENYFRWNTLLDSTDPGLTGPEKWYEENLPDADWQPTDLVEGRWGLDSDHRPVNGAHWLRKHIKLTKKQARQGAILRLGCIEGADSAYVNGVFVGTIGYQYPPRIYPVPEGLLHEGDNVVTVRVISGGGEPKVVPEKPYSLTLADGEKISLEGEWRHRLGVRTTQGPGMMFWHYTPVVLYDAMIYPLFNYPVEGVVWYQGESNVFNRDQYFDMLSAMMADWRKGYDRADLPFYIVELADFLHPSDTGGRAAWAEMREQQARTAKADCNAWLIPNGDLGEWNDIHPLDKKTLGHRVAKAVVANQNRIPATPLKDVFGNRFLIGAAVNVDQMSGADCKGASLTARHFNHIVAENAMKSEEIHPEKDRYHWADADRLVEFGEKNNIAVTGHCLIWHSQLAPWFVYDDNGKYVSADELKRRMRDHIHTIVGRYKGRISGWDVVNEAILEDGSYRKSPFYEILGEEFIPLAFQYAHEADPEAELYYNDYAMNVPAKRDAVVKLVTDLKKRGLRIDAIGMQGHMGMDYPDFREFEESIEAFAKTGCMVMITEWDMSALPTLNRGANVSDTVEYERALNPYPDGLPDDVAREWNARMESMFELFLLHSDKISRVTFWGVSDGDSWKNDWPMKGRKEYPLLFDRNYEMKPFMKKLMEKYGNPTVAIARSVLDREYIQNVSFEIVKDAPELSAPGSFRIGSEGQGLTLASTSEAGLLYGAYALGRLKRAGESICSMDTVETPYYSLRILDHWDNLDGTVERGYAGHSLWQWDELPCTLSPRYKEYAEKCAEAGINGAVLNNVNASPRILSSEYLVKVKGLADFLRPYGIRVYLSANFASPMVLDDLETADPLDPKVKKWWEEKVAKIYALIPDFGGFLVKANSEGQPGPADYGRTHADGANMMASALAPYGGIIMWRSFVYAPSADDRAKQAVTEFRPLDGEFADNVIVQIKNGPIDFQPREPYSPLFTTLKDTPMMVEFQVTQEYLGHSNHIVYLGPMWEEFFSDVEPSLLRGAAGVANIGDDKCMTGNLMADANRYAYGRLAWNPRLSSAAIAREWVEAHLFETQNAVPAQVKDDILAMMLSSREAAVDYMMPLGLHHIFAGNHHYGPEPWWGPEGVRPDWTPKYYHRADSVGLGFDRSATGSDAVSQYPRVLASIYGDIHTCPENLLLWFHHVPWTHRMRSGRTLWDELCLRYQRGIDTVDGWIAVWDAARPYLDPEAYADIRSRLLVQAKDARWWKDACLLYFAQWSRMPFPQGVEPPARNIEEYMRVTIDHPIYGNMPTEVLERVR